ncbi:hypothetical protein [Nocardia bovistercoris]|uniref:ESX-1 secretion-associated protein EspA/EspE-like domain-containing protein n=1 Tax=Nocardia bovistercoris TaxID=2785916 RepID=A0A931I9F9_9NOCA|nr:hypothetical protein [Nocardia bovistercoris]MBH0776786.1 hypothetical protein [Nocardia bovistercoris]
MELSVAQMQQIAEDLVDKVGELSGMPDKIQVAFNDAAKMPYVRYVLRIDDEIMELGKKFANAVRELWNKFVESLKGIAAPAFFISTSYDWLDVAGQANKMAGGLEDTAVKVDGYWQGAAAKAYADAITPQKTAVARIGTVANACRTAMLTIGGAGVAFYASLLGVVLSLVIEATMEVAAAGSGIGAIPAGVAGLVTTAKFATMVVTAITGMVAILNSEITQAQALQVELDNPQGFPSGHWPTSNSGGYSDATVTDADADWSVKTA